MRYVCGHCDLEFDSDDEKPRCTRCLRLSGVAPVAKGAGHQLTKPRSPAWLIVGLVSALAEMAAFLYGWLDPPGGMTGIAVMAGWVAWASVSALMIVGGLRGVLARMR